MTQKRFKKLMMSKGYSRNAVNDIAKNVRECGVSYSEVYTMSDIKIPAVVDAIRCVVEQMQNIVVAVGVAMRAFVETFNKKMKGGAG